MRNEILVGQGQQYMRNVIVVGQGQQYMRRCILARPSQTVHETLNIGGTWPNSMRCSFSLHQSRPNGTWALNFCWTRPNSTRGIELRSDYAKQYMRH